MRIAIGLMNGQVLNMSDGAVVPTDNGKQPARKLPSLYRKRVLRWFQVPQALDVVKQSDHEWEKDVIVEVAFDTTIMAEAIAWIGEEREAND